MHASVFGVLALLMLAVALPTAHAATYKSCYTHDCDGATATSDGNPTGQKCDVLENVQLGSCILPYGPTWGYGKVFCEQVEGVMVAWTVLYTSTASENCSEVKNVITQRANVCAQGDLVACSSGEVLALPDDIKNMAALRRTYWDSCDNNVTVVTDYQAINRCQSDLSEAGYSFRFPTCSAGATSVSGSVWNASTDSSFTCQGTSQGSVTLDFNRGCHSRIDFNTGVYNDMGSSTYGNYTSWGCGTVGSFAGGQIPAAAGSVNAAPTTAALSVISAVLLFLTQLMAVRA